MRSIGSLIYYLETTDLDDLDITDQEAVKLAKYLLANLRNFHDMPGKVWEQFCGICNWNNEYGMITAKQHYWLIIHLKQYINERVYSSLELM